MIPSSGGGITSPRLPARQARGDHETDVARGASLWVGLIECVTGSLGVAGTVVDVNLDRKRGQHHNEIEIIDAQGVEWEIDIDAKSGEVRRTKRDWDLF